MILLRAAQQAFIAQNIFRRLSVSSSEVYLANSQCQFSNLCCFWPKSEENLNSRRFPHSSRTSIVSAPLFSQIRSMSTEGDGATANVKSEKKSNRLALEKSPYLLQHATNPVDWYPWGNEAFEKAKKENKLIFLSVGYSTCHWCHVMEKESFESDEVAAILNQHYVCVKVDREERPDVDRLYMSYVQRTTGSGGWPMSVFLTPDLEPLFGGTYFPPEDKYGRVGFKTLLLMIAKQWMEKHSLLGGEAKQSVVAMKKMTEHKFPSSSEINVPKGEAWHKCLNQLTKAYDKEFGGFSRAPKFPQPTIFNFLFHMYAMNKKSEQGKHCLDMCLHTLKKMAYGGIHDHVNCGFARYSVDGKWHVPHFEKMLYDQAQIAVAYCDAYVVTKDEFYADVVRDILTYVSRDLTHPLGGFFGAEDADSYPCAGASHKQEGAFCVWEYDEIQNLLDEKTDNLSHAEIFSYHYNVKPNGNVNPAQDPHGELLNKNVLHVFGSYEHTAEKYDVSIEKLKEILSKCHKTLYDVRQQRPKPHVDTKIVTSWNGLMISAFAKAGFVLKDQDYINKAIQATNFVRKHLYDEKEKTLLRCCYRGDDGDVVQISTPTLGFLDDYAFMIRALLDLYESSLNADWLQWAEALQEQQNKMFWDGKNYGYFTSREGDPTILIRDKEDQDGAEPCGNSVAVHNLIRLAAYLDRKDLNDLAAKTLSAFGERLREIPFALPEMTSALMFYHEHPTQVGARFKHTFIMTLMKFILPDIKIRKEQMMLMHSLLDLASLDLAYSVFIAGEKEDNNTQALLDVVRKNYMPGRLLAIFDGPEGQAGLLYRRHATLARLKPVQGKSAAYVCRNFTCSLPVTEPADLESSLENIPGEGESSSSSH